MARNSRRQFEGSNRSCECWSEPNAARAASRLAAVAGWGLSLHGFQTDDVSQVYDFIMVDLGRLLTWGPDSDDRGRDGNHE